MSPNMVTLALIVSEIYALIQTVSFSQARHTLRIDFTAYPINIQANPMRGNFIMIRKPDEEEEDEEEAPQISLIRQGNEN